MTHNQIDYWKHKETQRHNVVSETEENRHNVTTERETAQHNRTTEGIDLGKLNESIRHNQATEGETNRHNLVTEGQTNVSLGYTGATLGEMIRHNKVLEALQGTDLSIKQGQLDESIRHNVSGENIDRYTAISQSKLNESRIALNEIQRTWDSLKNSAYVDLTTAQTAQLNNLSAKLESELSKINVETRNQQFEGAFIIYEEFLHGLDSFSRAVDALIPG